MANWKHCCEIHMKWEHVSEHPHRWPWPWMELLTWQGVASPRGLMESGRCDSPQWQREFVGRWYPGSAWSGHRRMSGDRREETSDTRASGSCLTLILGSHSPQDSPAVGVKGLNTNEKVPPSDLEDLFQVFPLSFPSFSPFPTLPFPSLLVLGSLGCCLGLTPGSNRLRDHSW